MKDTLHELLRQIRGFTISMLERAEADWLLFAPPGTSNHMIWHAGHALWVIDKLCIERLTGKSELSAGWAKKFGMDCTPVAEQTDWPTAEELKQLLTKQEVRLHELFDNMSEDQLVIRGDDNKDLVGGMMHGLHDEAKHHGEMYLLFKLCKAAAES